MLIQIASFNANAEAQGMVLISDNICLPSLYFLSAYYLPLGNTHILSTQEDQMIISTWFPVFQLWA